MIVSHTWKFIFIKTGKTAGTSVEIALSGFCGPQDIITPISPEDESLRAELGYRGPQNYRIPWRMYSWRDWRRYLKKFKRLEYYNHMPADEVRRYLPSNVWDGYFKFSVERNPWDRTVSQYYHKLKGGDETTFMTLDEFVMSRDVQKMKNFSKYTINGELVVDRVIRFENLTQELAEVCQSLGMDAERLVLPRAKAGKRRDKRPYREVLSQQAAAQIGQDYAPEIQMHGYEY